MFSGSVDQDGDRYGFVRNMKSPQDGINTKHSKIAHILQSNRLIISDGAVTDVEKTRAEWARPDGVIITHRPVGEGAKADDRSFDFAGTKELLDLNNAEIEGFGPNSELVGDESDAKSGRAIALRQQAGMAELGPYVLGYRGWKVRVYRAIWNAVQQHWKAERWIRVTDDEGLAQFIQINGMGGMSNAVGSLDVDIILDEGPDTVTMMQDMYETMSQVVPAIAPMLSPPAAMSLVELLIQASPMPSDAKKKFRDAQEQAAQQPQVDPEMQKAQMQAQIAQEKNAQDIQIKREQAAADIQLKREQAAADFELEQQRMQMEMQAQREKCAMEMDSQREKNAMDVETQRERSSMDVQAQRERHEMDVLSTRTKNEMDVQSTREKNEMASKANESKEKAEGEKQAKSDKSFQQIAEGFKDGMEMIAKAMTSPKSITVKRDASGKVTGASSG
jgi:hypothetical protein